MTRRVLLSVRPRFAQALLDGSKTAEVRRRFPDLPEGTEMLIYSSTPERAVLGTVQLRGVAKVSSTEVWDRHRSQIEISRDDLDAYLNGSDEASIVTVSEPLRWKVPVPLESLRRNLGVEPAQSYRYLTRAQAMLLARLSRGVMCDPNLRAEVVSPMTELQPA